MLDGVGRGDVGELLDWFFIPSIRNAFAHADYRLHEDRFRSRSELFEVESIQTADLALGTLVGVFNRALTIYGAFMGEYEEQRGSYRETRLCSGGSAAARTSSRSS